MGGKPATKTSNATLVSRNTVAKSLESFFKVSDILESGHLAAFKGSDPFVKHSDECICLFEFFRELFSCLLQVIDALIWVMVLRASAMERTTVARAVVARTVRAGMLLNWFGLRVVS